MVNNEELYSELENINVYAAEAVALNTYILEDIEDFRKAPSYISHNRLKHFDMLAGIVQERTAKIEQIALNLLLKLDKSEREVENVSSPKSVCAPAD